MNSLMPAQRSRLWSSSVDEHRASSAPIIEPEPPKMLTPPTTTAATTSSSRPMPGDRVMLPNWPGT